MDIKQEKQNLVDEYNKLQEGIVKGTQRQQQIIGALQIIEKQENENLPKPTGGEKPKKV